MKAPGKTQFNIEIPSSLAFKVRSDALRHNKTLSDVGTVIIGDFYKSFTVTERARIYAGTKNKKTGRKLRNLQEKMGVKVE